MVDAAVSMVLNRLAPIIGKKVREEVCLMLDANREAETLSSKLMEIQQVLMDAEQQGIVDRKVKSWLEKLQDICYDIDDVLDEWDLAKIKSQPEDAVDTSESSDPWEKVISFLQSVCLCFKETVKCRRIASDMKKLNERLDLIPQENEKEFKFIPDFCHDSQHDSQDFERIISTSFVDVSEVHGRDDDLKTMVDNLLPKSGSSHGEDGVQIVSIIGAGGIGKTTLAQLAFNKDTVTTHFTVKIWVCVSHPFNEIKIAKAILEVLKGSSPNLSELEPLLLCIQDSISKKRFLLVLDDVWTEDDTMWEPLKTCLINNGAPGSRILVTTRKMRVAKVFGSTRMQPLTQLSDDHCWSILSKIAFHEKSDGDYEMLKDIGRQIAQKCKGLPLAAKTLGGLLHSKKASLPEWQKVLESELWKLDEVKTGVFPFLALSYNELHPAVKRCFSYCAIFPKDFRIDVKGLIRIWMAQGFLSSSGTVSEMEVEGQKYFQDLAVRSFFQDFERGVNKDDNHITRCRMHDIVHDFAQFLTKNECLIIENVVGEAVNERISGKNVRHLNLLKYVANTAMDPYSICLIEKLCSFFCTESEIPPTLPSHLKRLRLLSLRSCDLREIPIEIGSLIHLRYLDLSWNNILKKLPETICDLYYLQTLDLRYCEQLRGLPQGVHKLGNLRHLLTEGTSDSFKFPQGFETLRNLQTLDYFCSAKGCDNKLGYLHDFNQLGGSVTLRIDDLDDESDVAEAEKADLKNKKFIEYLSLRYIGEVELRIMEALQPPPNLTSLFIRGPQLPKWIGTLANIRTLNIWCENIETERWHSISNLLFLEELILWGVGAEHLGLEFLGINKAAAKPLISPVFPKLKVLNLRHCYGWKEWEDIKEEDENIAVSVLPCLEELAVFECRDLKALPHRLLRRASSLRMLKIVGCEYLEDRYREGTGEDWDKISHIPSVRIIGF